MYTTSLTRNQFEKLKKFDPGKGVINVESELYIMGSKRSGRERKLLKRFFIDKGEYMGMKLLNINTLVYYRSVLEQVKELVLPETLAVVGGEIIGTTMPLIENATNLQIILSNKQIPLKDKIEYLKKIGRILINIDELKGFPYEFRLGDLHEANFIVDKEHNLHVVDLDSSYISNNEPFTSKYLFLNTLLIDFPYKYKVNGHDDIIPSRDSDIYCYIMIILNTLAGCKMYELTIEQFYNYMNYLESIGINKDFLFSIEKIYHDGENENPLPYLEYLIEKEPYQAHHLVYKARTGLDLAK